MIALKLQLYQNMVNYRKENSFGYIQSYPLPTPSMVRGMAHSLLGLKEYKPLRISIQG
ncbi:CRISPR-associated protein Cas5, partial [Desulfurella sp.]